MAEGFRSYDNYKDENVEPVSHERSKSRQEIIKALDEILLELYMDDPEGTKERLTSFADHLKAKYHDRFEKFELYFSLVSDKPEEGEKPELFDFPKPDSVQAFITSLKKES